MSPVAFRGTLTQVHSEGMQQGGFIFRIPRTIRQFLSSRASAAAAFCEEKMSSRQPTSVPAGFDQLIEGAARALYRKGEVFYNPAQVVNRDLSVLVLRWFVRQRPETKPPLRILEALSATGLRSVRYFQEVPQVGSVLANDLDESAVETIRRNIIHNGLDPDKDIIPNHGDAIEVMSLARSQEKRFDVVDLDPYGSAAPFLDSAVQAVSDGGLLAVTCTDLAVLCGNSPEICYGRYNSTPLKGPTGHEMAVRTVFAAIQTAANRHSRAVEAVICVKIDFYVRLFVIVRDSKHLAQQTPSRMSMIFQCSDCGTQREQPLGRIRPNPVSNAARKKRQKVEKSEDNIMNESEDVEKKGVTKKQQQINVKYSPPLVQDPLSANCAICGGSVLMGGPIWNGPLIGEGVAESLMKEIEGGEGEFKARDRVGALVRLVDEEVRSIPLFMHLPSMCKILRVSPPPAASVRSVLLKKGFQVSQSHTDPQAIKTDAKPEFVWDILRIWVQKVGSPYTKAKKNEEISANGNQNPTESRRSPVGERILATKPALLTKEEIDFTVKKDKFARRGNPEKPAVRYPQNPEPYWGPKARAGKRKREDVEQNGSKPTCSRQKLKGVED